MCSAPEPQRGDVHDDEQRRQQRARRDRVHRQRQQRDADDGKAAAERALHEGNQEDAGQGDREHERRGQVSDDGRDHGVVRSVVVVLNMATRACTRNPNIALGAIDISLPLAV